MGRQGTLALVAPFWCLLALSKWQIATVWAQTTGAFVQTVAPCPSDANITGYVNIADMNDDMVVELDQIRNGRAPQPPYVFLLCPETQFDATTQPLQPILNGAVFMCGMEGDPALNCRFMGGADQVVVDDPENVPQRYMLESISFMGLTFTGFNNSAISGTATAPTTISLYQCNFDVSATDGWNTRNTCRLDFQED
jgi:hypothetical protein